MSANSKIEWTDHTFNPWTGCTKVSPACDGCYAEAWSKRAGPKVGKWGPGMPRVRTTPANWNLPLRWNAQAEAFMAQHGRQQRVFCASLADVFDNEAPEEWRIDLSLLITMTPHLEWLLLTKRIGNAAAMLADMFPLGMPSQVWIGATIVNQAEADRDIPKLLATPAARRFLSMEPLLGPVDLGLCDCDKGSRPGPGGAGGVTCPRCSGAGGRMVDWVIVGGESGPGARPMHPDWAHSLRDQCQAAGVPFFFKQWGEWLPICEDQDGITDRLYRSNRKAEQHENQSVIDELYGRSCTVPYEVIHRDGSRHHPLEPNAFITGAMTTFKAGKKAADRLLDGRTWDEVPA